MGEKGIWKVSAVGIPGKLAPQRSVILVNINCHMCWDKRLDWDSTALRYLQEQKPSGTSSALQGMVSCCSVLQISFHLWYSHIQAKKLSPVLFLDTANSGFIYSVSHRLDSCLQELWVQTKGKEHFLKRLKMKDSEGNWRCWEGSRRSWAGKKKDKASWKENRSVNALLPGPAIEKKLALAVLRGTENLAGLWSFQSL